MQEVYGDQNTSNNTQAKDRFSFFLLPPIRFIRDYMRYGLHVVDLAEVYVLYIFVTGACII